MAVNFSKLPPLEPMPENPPSRIVWTIVFFVIVIAGIFMVLLLWPKGEPTQTPWFWTCVTVYPLGIATFVVLRRYSVYEGRRLDAIAWNDARESYVNDVFDRASRPLGILVATCRFASEAKDDDFGKLLDGSAKLEPRTAPESGALPVNARWFEKPDTDEGGMRFRNDDERRRYVLAWAFSVAIDAVAEVVRSLPPDLRLKVQLMLPGVVDTDEALAIWERRWAWTDLRPVQVRLMPEPSDLMYADAWLDRVNRRLDEEARLLVCVRLNAICQALPLDGSAETMVALLVAPEAVCQKFALAPIAMFHRPNGTDDCAIGDALARTLRWGCSKPADIKRIWQGGLDGAGANAVTKAVVKAGMGAKVADIDYMVGHAGPAAPWFAVACAANGAMQDGAPQLVATAGKTGVCFSVMRSVT
ncbi:hypothetical protein M3I53_37225 [Paraburkholderia sp. CNPSo 3272]|uniref:hypothetical protein n=1 Tax=Paraburkholderia sp. CNPSo 3272 TaxID=2940931 RepID=UPI0020B6831D|nr:hypothetical protein [Paraburkholderia sp. CNPSo 3272]MCP3728664.1 hypothetical protein [Paraburkholderia sp. CNPSo 3272]